MIGFLAPVWLAGLAALAVPLAIHLWSHRPRRPVRVGSIRLLSGVPPAAVKALRLHDPWLLALRLGILAALVLALAAPYWAPRDRRHAVWALLAEEALADRALLDSLREAGAELRLLDAGIPALDDAAASPRASRPHYWSLLAEADRLAPPGTRFLVAAPLVADRFRGTRPALAATVTWRDVPPAGPGAALPGQAQGRRVVILADPAHGDDARYLEAAIRAAAQVTGPAADVARANTSDAARFAADADWIGWLARGSAPPAVLDRARAGAVLFTQVSADSLATAGSTVRLAVAGPAPALERRAPFDGAGAPLWTDGAGVPLLSASREGRGLRYRLYARLHPAAGGLVLSPAFAEAMAALWIESAGVATAAATGAAPRIALSQALPAVGGQVSGDALPPGAVMLATPLWLLAALGLVFERWLALRRGRLGT